MPRYYKRPTPEPPQPFAWDVCYRRRVKMLARMIALNAPEAIIEMNCRSLLKAITRRHNSVWTLLRWARHEFHSWRHLKWFEVKWGFCRYVLRWSHDRCEKYFFSEHEESDPEVEQLRQMAGLEKKEK